MHPTRVLLATRPPLQENDFRNVRPMIIIVLNNVASPGLSPCVRCKKRLRWRTAVVRGQWLVVVPFKRGGACNAGFSVVGHSSCAFLDGTTEHKCFLLTFIFSIGTTLMNVAVVVSLVLLYSSDKKFLLYSALGL